MEHINNATINKNAPKSQATRRRTVAVRHPREELDDDEFIRRITSVNNPRAFANLNR